MAKLRGLRQIRLFALAEKYMNTSPYKAGNPFDDAVVTLETYK
jgi:hypothetical protein